MSTSSVERLIDTKDGWTAIPNALIRSSLLTKQERLIWMYIASYDPSFPSYDLMEYDLGVTEKTIRDALKKFKEMGMLDWERGGPTKANVYTVFPTSKWIQQFTEYDVNEEKNRQEYLDKERARKWKGKKRTDVSRDVTRSMPSDGTRRPIKTLIISKDISSAGDADQAQDLMSSPSEAVEHPDISREEKLHTVSTAVSDTDDAPQQVEKMLRLAGALPEEIQEAQRHANWVELFTELPALKKQVALQWEDYGMTGCAEWMISFQRQHDVRFPRSIVVDWVQRHLAGGLDEAAILEWLNRCLLEASSGR